VVQHGSALQAYVEDIDREPPVRLMVRGIYAALDAAGSASAGVLLAGAREDGRTFLGFVTGSPWPATFMASVGGRLHLIMDAANDLPLHDAEQVEGLIQAGERAVAFENLCTQIYEYEIRLPSGLRDTVASTGEQLGVASRYWERLEFGG
jgi:hypothetical protein